jgi:ParB-like chromosome segregation protein Spo0J
MSEFRCLRVDELILDKNNPRIQAALEFHDTVDDVKIGMALGANAAQFEGQGTTYQSLRDSIKQYGGIFNPIIVNENENGLLVVEGNTRVHIYRDFIKNNVPGNWNEIPAIVYQNAEKEQMDAFVYKPI